MWYILRDCENSHSSPEPEVESSEAICWDGERFAPSKSKTTLGGYCSPDSATVCSQDSRFGMTLRRSTDDRGEGVLMWYRGDSPVKTYLPQERAKESTEAGLDYGPRWPGSLARYNPVLRSWRTAQCSLLGGLIEFSETWPRWGMMRDGECSELTPLVLVSCENGCGLWPANVSTDYKGSRTPDALRAIGRNERNNLRDFLRAKGGWLYPPVRLVESLMMWPIGWTELKPLEMDKFRQWLRSHGKS